MTSLGRGTKIQQRASSVLPVWVEAVSSLVAISPKVILQGSGVALGAAENVCPPPKKCATLKSAPILLQTCSGPLYQNIPFYAGGAR